jgi:hypothetical protein
MNVSTNLDDRCRRGLARPSARHSGKADEASNCLERELADLDKAGWIPAMLAAADLAEFAREHGIGVGPGRGAVVGSVAAFLAGITDLNPLEHRLLFERFQAGLAMPGAVIALEVEKDGYPAVRERLDKMEGSIRVRLQVLPSDHIGTLCRTARLACPSLPVEDVFDPIPLDDTDVLAWLDRARPRHFLTAPVRRVQPMIGSKPVVSSFEDVITAMRFLHFPVDGVIDWRPLEHRRPRPGCPGLPDSIADVVAATHGTLIYQEQAMQLMNQMAGIPLTDAFHLLRMMRTDVKKVHQLFIDGCRGRGYIPNDVRHVWLMLAKGTACGCRAYFAALALTNFRWAFLQVHHPEACRVELSRRHDSIGEKS